MRTIRLTPDQTRQLSAAMTRVGDFIRQIVDAFREMARQAVRVLSALADFARRHARQLTRATAQQRPAWMSPYGPPARGRHRRR